MADTFETADALVRRSYGFTVRSINEERREAEFVFSAATIDSYDEIVEQDWDLTRFKKNPVILYNHNRNSVFGRTEDSLPIGRSPDFGVKNGQLEGIIKIATAKAHPFADLCWNAIVERTLSAVSVGFDPGDVRQETHDGKDVYVLSRNKLFEVSLTPIGACEDAIGKSAEASSVRAKELERFKFMATRRRSTTVQVPISLPPSGGERKTMDPKEMEAEIAKQKGELEQQKKAYKALEEQFAMSQKELAVANEKLKSLDAEKTKLEADQIVTDVKGFVGTKITSAQVEDYVELRTTMGKEKFASFMEKATDISSYTQHITKGTGPSSASTITSPNKGASSRLAKMAFDAAKEQGLIG